MNNAGGFVEQIRNIVKDTLYPILKNYPRIVSARVISIQDRLAVVRMPYAEDDSNDFNAYVVTSQLVSAGDVVNVAYWASLSTAVVLSNTSTLAAGGGGESGNYNNLENKPSINSVTLIGNKTPADFGLYGTDNAPPYPVKSVNTKTGDVVLTASDVNALPDTTVIPTKTSDLTNDSGFLTEVPIASDDTLGGVKVGGDFDIGEDGTLSIYKALTLSASVSPSSAEIGSTIDDVTVSWTVNKTPVSQSVEGIDVPVSDRSKALHDLGVTANRTFTVTAADARMSLTRNPGITFYRYVYSKVGSADAAPTQASECVKQADLSTFGSNGADFNYTARSTLWLLTTKVDAQIQTNVLGQWADVTTINAGTVEFTQANGAVVTYYAYNTGVFGGTGSAKYRIR